MTLTNDNNPTQIQFLTEKIEQLTQKIEQLQTNSQQLTQKIEFLETSQAENLIEMSANQSNFLQQLTEMLNSKKSSSMETILQELTKALQMMGFEVNEQRNSQDKLTDKIQQFLIEKQVMSILHNKPPDNS